MTFAERYVESAQAVVEAMRKHAEAHQSNGSSAYKALLTPAEFHGEVLLLTCVSMGISVTESRST